MINMMKPSSDSKGLPENNEAATSLGLRQLLGAPGVRPGAPNPATLGRSGVIVDQTMLLAMAAARANGANGARIASAGPREHHAQPGTLAAFQRSNSNVVNGNNEVLVPPGGFVLNSQSSLDSPARPNGIGLNNMLTQVDISSSNFTKAINFEALAGGGGLGQERDWDDQDGLVNEVEQDLSETSSQNMEDDSGSYIGQGLEGSNGAVRDEQLQAREQASADLYEQQQAREQAKLLERFRQLRQQQMAQQEQLMQQQQEQLAVLQGEQHRRQLLLAKQRESQWGGGAAPSPRQVTEQFQSPPGSAAKKVTRHPPKSSLPQAIAQSTLALAKISHPGNQMPSPPDLPPEALPRPRTPVQVVRGRPVPNISDAPDLPMDYLQYRNLNADSDSNTVDSRSTCQDEGVCPLPDTASEASEPHPTGSSNYLPPGYQGYSLAGAAQDDVDGLAYDEDPEDDVNDKENIPQLVAAPGLNSVDFNHVGHRQLLAHFGVSEQSVAVSANSAQRITLGEIVGGVTGENQVLDFREATEEDFEVDSVIGEDGEEEMEEYESQDDDDTVQELPPTSLDEAPVTGLGNRPKTFEELLEEELKKEENRLMDDGASANHPSGSAPSKHCFLKRREGLARFGSNISRNALSKKRNQEHKGSRHSSNQPSTTSVVAAPAPKGSTGRAPAPGQRKAVDKKSAQKISPPSNAKLQLKPSGRPPRSTLVSGKPPPHNSKAPPQNKVKATGVTKKPDRKQPVGLGAAASPGDPGDVSFQQKLAKRQQNEAAEFEELEEFEILEQYADDNASFLSSVSAVNRVLKDQKVSPDVQKITNNVVIDKNAVTRAGASVSTGAVYRTHYGDDQVTFEDVSQPNSDDDEEDEAGGNNDTLIEDGFDGDLVQEEKALSLHTIHRKVKTVQDACSGDVVDGERGSEGAVGLFGKNRGFSHRGAGDYAHSAKDIDVFPSAAIDHQSSERTKLLAHLPSGSGDRIEERSDLAVPTSKNDHEQTATKSPRRKLASADRHPQQRKSPFAQLTSDSSDNDSSYEYSESDSDTEPGKSQGHVATNHDRMPPSPTVSSQKTAAAATVTAAPQKKPGSPAKEEEEEETDEEFGDDEEWDETMNEQDEQTRARNSQVDMAKNATKSAFVKTKVSSDSAATKQDFPYVSTSEQSQPGTTPPTSKLVSKLFPKLKPDKPKAPTEQERQQEKKLLEAKRAELGEGVQSKVLRDKLVELEREIDRFRKENATLDKLRKEREEGLEHLKKEMGEFDKQKNQELHNLEEYKAEEMRKLRKEKRVFEQYQKASRALPDKKEREEMENLKKQLSDLQDELKRKELRWTSSATRLRDRVEQLEQENKEMKEEVRLLERRRLETWVQNNDRGPTAAGTTAAKESSAGQAMSGGAFMRPQSQQQRQQQQQQQQQRSTGPKQHQQTPVIKTDDTLRLSNNLEAEDLFGGPRDSAPRAAVVNGSTLATNGTSGQTTTGSEVNRRHSSSPRTPPRRAAGGGGALDGKAMPRKTIVALGSVGSNVDKGDEEYEEVQHQDGKTERVYSNGAREILFSNGTRKQVSSDGQRIIVSFFNGDIKQILPDQRVVYYYSENQTTHTTYPDGLEILQFPNNQMEKHYPDGTREITFPDQTIKYLFPTGLEENIYTDGTVVRVEKNGDRVLEFPNGQREVHTEQYKRREYPDGTVKTVYPDGRQETRYSSGRIRVKDQEGNIIVDRRV